MAFTLYETLRQIDPYVKLNDGCSIRTVEQVLTTIDPADTEEYAMFSDSTGRLLIYRIAGGYPIRPPAFIEEKAFTAPAKKRKAKAPPA